MKKYFLLLLFVSLGLLAQNQRFIYEYQFKTDSTKLDSAKSEIMYLDVSKKGSKFYSVDKFKADSTIDARQKNNPNQPNFSGIKFGQINTVVEKTYPEYKVALFDFIEINNYMVSDDRKMNWKILNEKEKIGEFETQKAETFIYARKWTAWFTTEIPIQDGPYKFHGLPGMIVKVADSKNTHVFELKAIKKLSQSDVWKSEADRTNLMKVVKVDEKQFKKIFLEHRENPTKGIRQMLASGAKVMMTGKDGQVIDIEENLRQQERTQKEENKRNNNLLELDLLK
ncbi:GLPGLI family protein [uncultured Chryseobacterium sp.]|uniref:GLPGLI family protein n=1 Tax=uncultured Chryseobacterium sp. TaxID=259322 RepID=UPI00261CAF9E|nr:GLPGLI family protein [uncultured Chryseobacterium sp.]